MASEFPQSLDEFRNPSPETETNDPDFSHAAQHANANDAIEALQAKVGVDGSDDPASLDYRIAAVEAGKEASGAASAAVAGHTSALDPHPQYTTPAEAAAFAPVQSVAGKAGNVALAKADVGLSNVDNTSDVNKPVSSAVATALAGKQDTLISGTNIKTINGQPVVGAGNMALVASPAGTDKQLQFNDGGAFGGDSGLTYDKVTKTLTVGKSALGNGSAAGAALHFGNPLSGFYTRSQTLFLNVVSNGHVMADIANIIGWCIRGPLTISAADPITTPGVSLHVPSVDVLDQRRGTNAQAYRIYNVYTDASNYERVSIGWSANVCYARTEKAGTGAARLFIPVTGAATVTGLPAASTAGIGARAFVTDSTQPHAAGIGNAVVGGGTNKVPVYSDGTQWLIG